MEKKYTFFWRDKSPFSQWHPVGFKDEEGNFFKTAEHWMMFKKAKLFGDETVAQKVLKSGHPSKAKKLGREVKNFDSKIWDQHKFNIVKEGNVLKFSQNQELKEKLLETGDTFMVEASPYDRIWGIGLEAKDAKNISEEQWPGENLLGKALDEVRAQLLKN